MADQDELRARKDADGNALACFQLGEVAGYAFGPTEGAERP